MSAADAPGSLPSAEAAPMPSEPHSVYREIAALALLVGIAVGIGVVDLLVQGRGLSWTAAIRAWNWVFDVVLVILAVAIVLWILRLIFAGVGGVRGRDRRRRRWAEQATTRDPALEIVRSRFARGEISKEQLDELAQQLASGN